ncbi:unnamed protein product [Alopecurus aequalis]
MADHGRKKAALPSNKVVHGRSAAAAPASLCGAAPRLLRPSEPAAAAFAASNSWWPGLAAPGPVPPISADWENDVYPPGGFVNYLRNPSSFMLPHQVPLQQTMSQDSQFVSPPVASSKKRPSGTSSSKRSKRTINVETLEDDEEDKTTKRLPWTSDEDERLMSAWLKNSNDPICGNFKKNDKYWGDVVDEYNSNTPQDRRRQKRDVADLGEEGKHKPEDDDDIGRPQGTKAAKAERDGKGKGSLKSQDLEELEKFYKVQMEATRSRTDVLEAQKCIAADKLESSRLILLAAKENKEAKTKSKMLEQYGKLMTQDMRDMTDVQKAEHAMALKLMREALFSKEN